jgi:thiol-disulfide isomerase/thioredoxin
MISTISLLVLLIGGQGKGLDSPPASTQLLPLSALMLNSSQGPAPVAHEFVAAKGEWIQKPVTLKSLKGKVVLVDFWAYTCVNCIRTFPYVNEWYKRYHRYGLEIVAIHRPEFDFEGDPKNVKAAAKRFGFTFPVLNDLEGTNWTNYGVNAWPTKILVDPKGKIVYMHVGEGHYDEVEQQLQRELAQINPGVRFGMTMAPVRATDAPGAMCQPCTLESFAASPVLSHFSPDQRGKKILFSYPAKHQTGFYYSGYWTPTRGFMQEGGNATVSFGYWGKEVNSVLRPSSGAVVAEIYQDGRPLAANELGDDVKMVNGVPTMRIVEPKMYSVIRNPKWGIHQLEFRFKNPGARLYTLTFGTDCRPLPKRKK